MRRFRAERPDFEEWFEEEEGTGSNQTPPHTLAIVIDPQIEAEVGFGPDLVDTFWEEIGGEHVDVDDPDYLAGFIEGALG